MKKNSIVFFAVLATALSALSGCAVHNRVSFQDQLQFTIINNTSIELQILSDGRVTEYKLSDGRKSRVLPSAETTVLGYYAYMGEREIVVSARGICPDIGFVHVLYDTNRRFPCRPGQVVGNQYGGRLFVYGDGTRRRAESWMIEGVRPLTGGLSF